jgi:hypothetical protein
VRVGIRLGISLLLCHASTPKCKAFLELHMAPNDGYCEKQCRSKAVTQVPCDF